MDARPFLPGDLPEDAPGDFSDSPSPPGPPDFPDVPGSPEDVPDPVRAAAVRAFIIVSLTLTELVVLLLCLLASTWLALPVGLCTLVSAVIATWAVLDIWVTRQSWVQRNGVASMPSSAARPRRRPTRRE